MSQNKTIFLGKNNNNNKMISNGVGLKILYEDDKLVVVDKLAGLPVFTEGEHSSVSVADLLISQFPQQKELGEGMRYGIAHRLDKDTSGVLLVAKTKDTFEHIQSQFKARKTEKRYVCLVVGTVKEDRGTIVASLMRAPSDRRKQKAVDEGTPNAREAITEFRVLKRVEGYKF